MRVGRRVKCGRTKRVIDSGKSSGRRRPRFFSNCGRRGYEGRTRNGRHGYLSIFICCSEKYPSSLLARWKKKRELFVLLGCLSVYVPDQGPNIAFVMSLFYTVPRTTRSRWRAAISSGSFFPLSLSSIPSSSFHSYPTPPLRALSCLYIADISILFGSDVHKRDGKRKEKQEMRRRLDSLQGCRLLKTP